MTSNNANKWFEWTVCFPNETFVEDCFTLQEHNKSYTHQVLINHHVLFNVLQQVSISSSEVIEVCIYRFV